MNWLCLAPLILSALGPNQGAPRNAPGLTDAEAKKLEQLGRTTASIGLRVTSQLLADDPEGNACFSPASATMALALLARSTSGPVQAQLKKALGGDLGAYNVAARTWKVSPTISFGNAIWAKGSVNAAVANPISRDLSAEIRPFKSPGQALAEINGWVAKATKNRIPRLFDQLEDQVRLVLANAIWFKDDWVVAFDPGVTRNATFHLPRGRAAETPMMHKMLYTPYFRGAKFEAVQLNYKSGGSMTFILPTGKTTLGELAKDAGLAEFLQHGMAPTMNEGFLTIPRFNIGQTIDLTESLKTLGLASVFNAQPYPILRGAPRLAVGAAIQKTWLAVNEKGTEGAAATGIASVGSAPSPGKTFNFVADRPFLYVVRDTYGLVLFVGTVSDPRE